MNNEQQELLDEAYKNYLQHYSDEYNEEQKKLQNPLHWMEMEYTNFRPYPKEEFINKCKTDTELSEKWGLTIEERELSLEERAQWLQDNTEWDLLVGNLDHDHIREVVEEEAQTKLITIKYNDKTIESYE
jgi:hypothetical protein